MSGEYKLCPGIIKQILNLNIFFFISNKDYMIRIEHMFLSGSHNKLGMSHTCECVCVVYGDQGITLSVW